MDSNPIAAVRKKSGLSRIAFAAALGVSYQELWQAENGYRPNPEKVLRALGGLGYDAAGIRSDLEHWHTARTAAARQKAVVES